MKTMFFNFRMFASLGLIAFIFVACKRSQPKMPPPSKDCQGRGEISADFKIMEHNYSAYSIDYGSFYTDTDTIFANKLVKLIPKEQDLEYCTWYIDGGVYKYNPFEWLFGSDRVGETINITLAVKKKQPDLLCFPNDDGYDSITKTVYVAPTYGSPHIDGVWGGWHPLVGTYRFFAPQLNDSIDVEFRNFMKLPNGDGPAGRMYISNVDGKGTVVRGMPVFEQFAVTYREIQYVLGDLIINKKEADTKKMYVFGLHHDVDGVAHLSMKQSSQWMNLPEYNYKGRKL